MAFAGDEVISSVHYTRRGTYAGSSFCRKRLTSTKSRSLSNRSALSSAVVKVSGIRGSIRSQRCHCSSLCRMVGGDKSLSTPCVTEGLDLRFCQLRCQPKTSGRKKQGNCERRSGPATSKDEAGGGSTTLLLVSVRRGAFRAATHKTSHPLGWRRQQDGKR